jgi:pimeloyl-ACP methyl ester carboxylesterase
LSDFAKAAVQGTLRRQAEFESADAAFQRYRAAPVFAKWTDNSLRAYIRHGFMVQEDGRVRLRCTPEIESAVMLPIFEAIEQVYSGDARGNPFAWLSEIRCPVRVAITEQSWSIHKEMVSRAFALLPAASKWNFEGVGHSVAQEAPERVLQALQAFAAGID